MSNQTPLSGLDIGRQLRETATPFQRFHALCVGDQFREAAAAFRLLAARLDEGQRAPYWVAQAPRRHGRAHGTPRRRSTARRS
ncbi:hypothetical protein SAMN05216483_6676 [Streptomyces sp. 2131.1]|uniref:hypothetical protein n=1 Tax=Streptomyces sp. 2131.1 TaxID=1855346 RepID=UPI000899189F|nr:hypothetical protein [Streptomyces sp. 2131.1]SEE82680.1 hypothetical protein SAMN05216483_6676 [Streptomyces sp. 2131.1]